MAPFSTKIGGRVIQRTFGITLACLILGVIIFVVEAFNGLDMTSPSAIMYFFIALLSGGF
jgi:glucose uptake protein GlcU